MVPFKKERTAMADIAKGTQFSDLPCCLVIEILLRLPLKALLICRYVRKDWTRLYFSDPYFIRRQLETSNIQFLGKHIRKKSERKFQFGCFVEEVSTGNLGKVTLDISCKLLHDPNCNWCVVNSCNGLVCLFDKPYGYYGDRVYVCNPILGEWVSIPVRSNCYCALGFSAKNDQYKILQCIEIEMGEGEDLDTVKREWEIYTLGTEEQHWRSIKTKETIRPYNYFYGINFNTFIHGSLHWANDTKKVQSFDFETERFRVLSLPELQSACYLDRTYVELGVINGCLWASFHSGGQNDAGEMWAMKEYGDEKSWTMMLAFRNTWNRGISWRIPDDVLRARNKECVIYEEDNCIHDLLFSLNGEEILTSGLVGVKCYNIKMPRRRALTNDLYTPRVIAYNPSFVSLPDFGRGQQVLRGRETFTTD